MPNNCRFYTGSRALLSRRTGSLPHYRLLAGWLLDLAIRVLTSSQCFQRPLEFGVRVVEVRRETHVFAAGAIGAKRGDDVGGAQSLAQLRGVASLAIERND